MSDATAAEAGFGRFGLPAFLMKALDKAGYEQPTPIQEQIISLVLGGHDVIGQAQTGTGKTAAFALPLLAQLDMKAKAPQVLVLAPTRELAVQVATAFDKYGAFLKGLNVAPIYGGADMRAQLRQLKRGAQVVVGTPGRVMDHMRRGSLSLDSLTCLVLDEADEMLRMGFIEDVEWILEQAAEGRQIALFSATMPPMIRKIAKRYLDNPHQISLKAHTAAADTIRQRVCRVQATRKLEALTRILDAESIEKALIFVRTRVNTTELAEKLQAHGHRCAPLNGDIPQRQRERTVDLFKTGKLGIIIATDVAARGLHIDGISHVINYDAAGDVETYVHRIGRTGRAGKTGEAILFVGPRDRRQVATIERVTKATIEEMAVPSAKEINKRRVSRFKERILQRIAGGELEPFEQLLSELQQESDVSSLQAAAALASLVQGDEPLLVKDLPMQKAPRPRGDGPRGDGPRSSDGPRGEHRRQPAPRNGRAHYSEEGMSRFRLELGTDHGIKHANIVGAIANETGMPGRYIGRINIEAQHSTVDLPNDMPDGVVRRLQKVQIFGKPCRIRPDAKKKPRKPKRPPAPTS